MMRGTSPAIFCPSFLHSSQILNRQNSFLLFPSQSNLKTLSFSKSSSNDLDKNLQRDFCDEGFEIEVSKIEGKMNRRKIRSRVLVNAEISNLWSVLTDYNGMAGFIPSLAVSQLLEKRENFARLYQVGEQNLALGLKFNAKGVLECYEGDLEDVPFGQRRDIEFRMVEGDFQTFEGKWYIEQIDDEAHEDGELLLGQEYKTTLSYVVEVEPKFWLPVHLLEGRLCREVKINLLCIRDEAQRIQRLGYEVTSSRKIGDGLSD